MGLRGRGHAMPSEAHVTTDFGGGENGDTIVGVGDGEGEGKETERVRVWPTGLGIRGGIGEGHGESPGEEWGVVLLDVWVDRVLCLIRGTLLGPSPRSRPILIRSLVRSIERMARSVCPRECGAWTRIRGCDGWRRG